MRQHPQTNWSSKMKQLHELQMGRLKWFDGNTFYQPSLLSWLKKQWRALQTICWQLFRVYKHQFQLYNGRSNKVYRWTTQYLLSIYKVF